MASKKQKKEFISRTAPDSIDNSNTDAEAQQPLLAPRQTRSRSSSPHPSRPSTIITNLKIRTPLERVLVGLAIGLLISCAIVMGLYIRTLHHRRHTPFPIYHDANADLCVSPECVLSSARILNAMNASVDPCTDFYSYACGGWEHANDIPDSKSRIGTFDYLSDENKRIIRDILTSEIPPTFNENGPGDNQVAEKALHIKARTFYSSCLDEQKLNTIGAKPLKAIIDKYLNAFPISSPSKGLDKRVLADVLAEQHAIGVGSLVDVDIISDDQNPTVQVIVVSQANTYLPSKEYYLEPRITEIYARAIATTFNSFYTQTESTLLNHRHGKPRIPKMPPQDPQDPNIPESPFPNDPIILPTNRRHPGDGIRKPHIPIIPPRDPHDPNIPESPFPNDPIIIPNADIQRNTTNWDAIAAGVVEFEAKLAHEWMPNEDQGDPRKTYNPITIKDLELQSQVLPWEYYLSKLAVANGASQKISKADKVIMATPAYLKKVDQIVQTTSPQVLNTYLAWRVINAYMSATSEATQRVLDELRQAVHGIPPQTHTPRIDYCLALTDHVLGLATGRWFVAKAFPTNLLHSSRDMIASILDAFGQRLDDLTWLDAPTREKAKRKARSLDRKVGFPDIVTNVTAISAKYDGLRVDRDDHFGNYVRAIGQKVREQWRKLGQPTDYTEWGMTSATVNAYYNPSHNEIVFPAGILRPPFFSGNVPAALNYGAIGVVAGHELGHAFDNNGRWYDEQGKLVDWWGNQTAKEFEHRAQCFVDQYEKFSIVNPEGQKVHVNGRLTLGENLADNGGVSQSWAAWWSKYSEVEKNVQLPGLEGVGSEKLFFLGFANVWCGKMRPETALSRIRTDPHSPAFVRVNAAVQNSMQFAHAFQCSENSPMNPKNKCELW